MAEVFKACTVRQEAFAKLVAIKRILPIHSDDARFVEMFIEEARLVANLNHGNIVQVFDFGVIDGSYYLAMELVEGWDLHKLEHKLWSQGQSLPIAIALHICMSVCNGLAYAHQRCDAEGNPLGIVHRDVSPQNVLLSFDGDVKLSDFGIAKAAARVSETTHGTIKGKFGYLSPEQITSRPADHRADLFSLGIVLHEMLCGQRLFVGDGHAAVIHHVLYTEVPSPSSLCPEVPPELDAIVLKALARDVERRYQSAESMSSDLADYCWATRTTLLPVDVSNWLKGVQAALPAEPARTPAPQSSSNESMSRFVNEAMGRLDDWDVGERVETGTATNPVPDAALLAPVELEIEDPEDGSFPMDDPTTLRHPIYRRTLDPTRRERPPRKERPPTPPPEPMHTPPPIRSGRPALEPAPVESATRPDTSVWRWLGITLIILMLVAATIGALLLSRRKADEEARKPGPATERPRPSSP